MPKNLFLFVVTYGMGNIIKILEVPEEYSERGRWNWWFLNRVDLTACLLFSTPLSGVSFELLNRHISNEDMLEYLERLISPQSFNGE